MRWMLISFLSLTLALPCMAQPAPDHHRAQVQAATGNAASNLREQVMRMPLGGNTAVRDFLNRTGGAAALSRALQHAQQVGDPRWVDENTCQVRLEISGAQLADLLLQDAREHPERSPLSPEELTTHLNEWNRLTFTAVGSSAGGASIDSVQPAHLSGPWSEVDDATRRRTIAAARQDAMHKMLDAVSDIQLSENLKIRDALARPRIADDISAWFDQLPVTRIELSDDLRATVTVATSPATLSLALQLAVLKDHDFSHDLSINWDRVQRDVLNNAVAAVGSSSAIASPSTSAPAAPSAFVLPASPPDWADTEIESEATAVGPMSRLKIARAAESVAIGKLHDKFLALPIGQTTLGEAAKADPQFAQSVNQIMLHAHTYRVDYHPDGSVTVHVRLDLRNAWNELRSNP